MRRSRRRQELFAILVVSVGLMVGCGDQEPDIGGSDTSGHDGESLDGSMADGESTDEDGGGDGNETDTTETEIEGEIDSEFAKDRGLRTLSSSEKADICRAGQEFLANNVTSEETCQWAAHYQAFNSAPDSDDEAVSQCEDAYQAWEEAPQDMDTCADIKGGHNCQAEVGQWEDCEEALIVQFTSYVADLPACSEVSSDYYGFEYRRFSPRFDDGVDDPEACQIFRDNCPDFYESWMGPIKWPE